jgi:hypothetical protein
MQHRPDREAKIRLAPAWNQMEIELRGQALHVSVNGREVLAADLDVFARESDALSGLSRQSGRIGLQGHTGAVSYRNIRIKPLPPTVATTVEDRPKGGQTGKYAEALSPRVRVLVEGLHDKDPQVRYRAAENLGKLGNKANALVVRALEEALGDNDGQVRVRVQMSLGQLGPLAKGAAPALARRIADERFEVFCKPGASTSAPLGDNYYPDKRFFYHDKDSALEALKKLAPDQVEQALVAASQCQNANVRRWALDRLSELDEKP